MFYANIILRLLPSHFEMGRLVLAVYERGWTGKRAGFHTHHWSIFINGGDKQLDINRQRQRITSPRSLMEQHRRSLKQTFPLSVFTETPTLALLIKLGLEITIPLWMCAIMLTIDICLRVSAIMLTRYLSLGISMAAAAETTREPRVRGCERGVGAQIRYTAVIM